MRHEIVIIKIAGGVDSFEKIRKDGFYYVDKTTLIEQLLEQWGEVNLFTARPRRFGKDFEYEYASLLFEIGADRSLFDGLDISKIRNFAMPIWESFRWCFFFEECGWSYFWRCKVSPDRTGCCGSGSPFYFVR